MSDAISTYLCELGVFSRAGRKKSEQGEKEAFVMICFFFLL